MTTKHRADIAADAMDIHAKAWKGRPEFKEASALLRTIPAMEAEIEKLKAENKALIDVITRAEVKPACNANSTSIRGI
jgi:hypothetical protein